MTCRFFFSLCVCCVWVTEGFLVPVRKAESLALRSYSSDLSDGNRFGSFGLLEQPVWGEGYGTQRGNYPVQRRADYNRVHYPTQPSIRDERCETDFDGRDNLWGTMDAPRMNYMYKDYDMDGRSYDLDSRYGDSWRDCDNWHGAYRQVDYPIQRRGDDRIPMPDYNEYYEDDDWLGTLDTTRPRYENYDRLRYDGVNGGTYGSYRYGDNLRTPSMTHGDNHRVHYPDQCY